MTSLSLATTDAAKNLRGIGMICLAVFCFALLDTGLKLMAEHFHPFQVAFLRSLASLPFLIALVPSQGGFASLWTRRWHLLILRGVIGVAMLCSFIYAYAMLPLADAYAIFFTSPLFLTALSVPMLKEKVGKHRWAAVLVGFVGVLIMVQPGGETMLGLGALAALVGTLIYTLNVIATRKLSRTETTGAITVYFTAAMAGTAGLLAIPVWQPVDWMAVLPLLGGIGIAGAIGQVFVTQAFRHGSVAVIAPFEYSSMIWAVMLGYLIWGDFPTSNVWLGCAIVVAAGLYILHRETRRQKMPAQPLENTQ